MAYDLTGNQDTILRAGGGLYYDRPDGNTVFSIPGNPPLATARDLRNGQLQTLGQGLAPVPVPALITFQYERESAGVMAMASGRAARASLVPGDRHLVRRATTGSIGSGRSRAARA